MPGDDRPRKMKQIETPKVIILTESVAQSWARDAGTVAASLALLLPGWWVQSGWISAVGLFMLCAMVLKWARGTGRESTLEEARDQINAMIAARADD